MSCWGYFPKPFINRLLPIKTLYHEEDNWRDLLYLYCLGENYGFRSFSSRLSRGNFLIDTWYKEQRLIPTWVFIALGYNHLSFYRFVWNLISSWHSIEDSKYGESSACTLRSFGSPKYHPDQRSTAIQQSLARWAPSIQYVLTLALVSSLSWYIIAKAPKLPIKTIVWTV
jgi:hypothetical protein